MSNPQQIVPGIAVNESGQATIDPSLNNVLFDLALNLEGPTGQPVDIQHVVAAIVLATRGNEIDAKETIIAGNQTLIEILVPHVKSIFQLYGGDVGSDT